MNMQPFHILLGCFLAFPSHLMADTLNMTWTEVFASFIGGAVGSVGIEVYNDIVYTFGGQGNIDYISKTYWADLNSILTSGSVSWSQYSWQDDPSTNRTISDGFRVTSSVRVNSTVYLPGPYPVLGAMLAFDLDTNTQIPLSNYSYKIGYPSDYNSFLFDGCITSNGTHLFYLGGEQENDPDDPLQGWTVHDYFLIYDIKGDSWSTGPSITSGGRSGFDCDYDSEQNVIWIFGGWKDLSNVFYATTFNTFQYFDLDSSSWSWSNEFTMDETRSFVQAPIMFESPYYNSGIGILIGGYQEINYLTGDGIAFATDVVVVNTSLNNGSSDPTLLFNNQNGEFEFNGKLPVSLGLDVGIAEINIKWVLNGKDEILNQYMFDIIVNDTHLERYMAYEYGLIVIGGNVGGSYVSDMFYLNLTYTRLLQVVRITLPPTSIPSAEPTRKGSVPLPGFSTTTTVIPYNTTSNETFTTNDGGGMIVHSSDTSNMYMFGYMLLRLNCIACVLVRKNN